MRCYREPWRRAAPAVGCRWARDPRAAGDARRTRRSELVKRIVRGSAASFQSVAFPEKRYRRVFQRNLQRTTWLDDRRQDRLSALRRFVYRLPYCLRSSRGSLLHASLTLIVGTADPGGGAEVGGGGSPSGGEAFRATLPVKLKTLSS